MQSLIGIAISVLLIVLLYKYIIFPCYLSPLARIPNAHFTAPILSTWIDSKRRNGTEVQTIYDLHQKHGPVVRLGPDELSVNSLSGLKCIYSGAFEKHEWYQEMFVNFGMENLVTMLHNKPHSERKRMLSRVYSKSYLQESTDLPKISSIILSDRLFPILDALAQNRTSTNVLPLCQAVGMDFISAYIFGTRNGTDFARGLPEWEEWLARYEESKFQDVKARRGGYVESWCLSLCDKLEKNEDTVHVKIATSPVVYSRLLQSLEKSHHPLSRRLAVASEMLDHLIAGHESTGIIMTYVLWAMSKHPELQRDLHQELLTLSPPIIYPFAAESDEGVAVLPSASSIDSLPLLDAIMRETLRLHSPVPGPLPRVTPFSRTPISIEGYITPGGVKVSSCAYTLHRISDVYVEPEKWYPERWLHPAPGKIHDMRRLMWAFGSGGKMCLGNNFALQGTRNNMQAGVRLCVPKVPTNPKSFV